MASTSSSSPSAIQEMSEEECWSRLREHVVGRLVVAVGRQPDVFPVNYRIIDGEVVVRTAAGTKLAAALMGQLVAFEIDEIDEAGREGWSVVVHGTAHESRLLEDTMRDDEIDTDPWVAGPKNRVIHIRSGRVTGRRIQAHD